MRIYFICLPIIVMKKVNKIFMFLGVSLFLAANSIFVNASEQVFYSDNYAEALHEIRNELDYTITIWAEYYFIVKNGNWQEVKSSIRSDRSKEFEQYCKDDLNIDLNSMLPKNVVQVKYDDEEKSRDVISDKGATGSGKVSQNLDSLQSEDVYASNDARNKKLYASNNTQNNPYQVTFNVNGWLWNDVTTGAICSYTLPKFTDVSFKPSAWKEFIWWSKNPSWPVITGKNIIVNGSTMLYAIWDYTCRNETGVYVLTGCPDNANCIKCPPLDNKLKFESCQTGYVDDGNEKCRSLDEGWTTGALKEYPLESCPEGAICAYTVHNDKYRYKIDHCQDDYKLQDGSCKCHTQLFVVGTLSGYYCSFASWITNSPHLILNSYDGFCTVTESLANEIRNTPRTSGFYLNVCDMWGRYKNDERVIGRGSSYELTFEGADYLWVPLTDTVQQRHSWHEVWTRREVSQTMGDRDCKVTDSHSCDYRLYFTAGACEDIGKKYFNKRDDKFIVPDGYSDDVCKQDCTGFTGDFCPENKKCLVCGGKYKAVADYYDNKGWKCYKLVDGMGMIESDECNCEEYKKNSKDDTIFTSIETGCSVNTYQCETDTNDPKKKEIFYSGVCGGCEQGYKMWESGKCEYIPCDGSYWMEAPMNLSCSYDEIKYGTCDNDDIRPTKEYVPMNGCKQEWKEFCEKHFGNDAYLGSQKWLTGLYNGGHGDARDGCSPYYYNTYFKCTKCEDGYELINDACIAKSGVGSICYHKRGGTGCYTYDEVKNDTRNVYTPIGIIFKATSSADYIVSLENLGGLGVDDRHKAFDPRVKSYFWEEAKEDIRDYAPNGCEKGSFCGQYKWRLPSVEEMQEIVSGFWDGGPLVQAIRWVEKSCSKENLKRLYEGGSYWTNQYTGVKTSVQSWWWGLFIQAAYTVSSYGWLSWAGIRDYSWDIDTAGLAYARPVLVIQKANSLASSVYEDECITEFAGMDGMMASDDTWCAELDYKSPYANQLPTLVCLSCKKGYCIWKSGHCELRYPDSVDSGNALNSSWSKCITLFTGSHGMYAYGHSGCALTGIYKPYSGVDAINVCLKCKSGYCYSDKTRKCEYSSGNSSIGTRDSASLGR